MRLSVNLLCCAGVIEERHTPLFELAKSAGYDGVEIPILSGAPADYAAIGRRLDALGLARTGTAIIPSPDVSPISDDAAVRARGAAHLDWALDCAAALGAETLGGPFHAPIGHFTGRGPTEDELARGAEAHFAMAERADGLGVSLSLEPLNRFETYFLNTAEQAAAYADRVGHRAFKIMYDTFHAHIEERDQPRAVRALGARIGVLHASENDRGVLGRGQIAFAPIFQAARAGGFDGWVVVEAFGDAVLELAAATRVWRPLFEDVETLFHESARHVRQCWDEAAA